MKWRVFWIGLMGIGAVLVALGSISRLTPTPEPVVMSCAEFDQQRPTVGYFQLFDCEADLLHSAYSAVSHGGILGTAFDIARGPSVKFVLVPLRSVDAREGEPATVVLAVDDAQFIREFRKLAAEEQHPDAAQLFGNHDHSQIAEWAAQRVFTGTLSVSPQYNGTYELLSDAILPGATILELNRAPKSGLTIGMFLVGLAFVAAMIVFVRSVRNRIRDWTAPVTDDGSLQLGELEQLRREEAEAKRNASGE